jgi:hypothetical protein
LQWLRQSTKNFFIILLSCSAVALALPCEAGLLLKKSQGKTIVMVKHIVFMFSISYPEI